MIFHHIWLGPKPFPYVTYRTSWVHLHPTGCFYMWTDENIKDLDLPSAFHEARSWAQKADILRYTVLYEHGGIYVDSDIECLKPIDKFQFPFCGQESKGIFCNALIGTEKNCFIMKDCLDVIRTNFKVYVPPNESTGPIMFTKVAKGRINAYPPGIFYPIGWDGKINGSVSEAYTNHHWAGSWKSNH